jgi:hypothetical protein
MSKLPPFLHRALEWTGHIHTGLWLWEAIGGGSLIAALFAVYQRHRSELDWIGIGAMFLISAATIYIALRVANYSRSHALTDAPGPIPSDAASLPTGVPWQSLPEPITEPRGGPSCSAAGVSYISLTRHAGETGAEKYDSATIGGGGEEEIKLDNRPKRVLFDGVGEIVGEEDLQYDINFGSDKRLTVKRFTDAGVVVDSHGSKIDYKVYVLDSEPRQSVIRSPLEQGTFAALYSEFMCLSWAQKIALKVICIRIVMHEIALSTELERLGFGSTKDVLCRIVNGLHKCSLIEFKPDGTLTINPVRTRDVEELVNGWKFEF